MAIKKTQRHARAMQKGIRGSFKNIEKQKQEKKIKVKDKKALIIAQEIKFARLLACNDKKIRDKVLKSVKKWLTVRSKSSFELTEADFMRLWKGLFYCMWMSDKPLAQEELAESLSKIVHCLDSMSNIMLYTKSTLQTLAIEWFGIDQYRLDKFAMLVRRILRQTFKICHDKNWNIEWVQGLMEILEQLLLDKKFCLGFKMHVTELYWEEIAKVSCGNLPEDVVTMLIKPFIAYLATIEEERLIKHIMRHIFRYLIFQSNIGIDYKEKFEAWKQAGFPCGNIEVMQKIEESDEDSDEDTKILSKKELTETTEKALDPRAGRVDVELPQISFNAKKIVELIKQYKFHPLSTTKSRRQIARLIEEFTEVSEGRMPLGIKEIAVINKDRSKMDPKKAALRLLKFDEELYSDSHRSKRKRKKNEQLDENLINESQENVTDEGITLESNKELNKKKRVNQDLKYSLHESNETIESSCLKDSKMTKVSALIIDRSKNKQKKRDQLESEILKHKKNDIDTVISNKVNKQKVVKMKSTLINEKNTTKNIIIHKLKKLKNNMCGQWDVSDNVSPIPLNPTNDNESKINNVCNGEFNTSISSDTSDVTFDKQIEWLRPTLKKSIGSTEHIQEQNKSVNDSGLKKRVKIVLQRNTAQHTSDYIQQIRKSPAIPFDANKKPLVGVLKASPMPSPVNPFYKRHVK
ncbi:ribosomal RNA processing protein 1 homolog [Vespa mandarinia]|uniref:ribosomal RNA processing protein 1 homolog n=1 Tax=Vespa mandarinia TaxID=7446 RepID=UPI001616C006|nr:ribosomal RNA processing protein 1 homolog [Vespa mandarinia]